MVAVSVLQVLDQVLDLALVAIGSGLLAWSIGLMGSIGAVLLVLGWTAWKGSKL